MAPLYCRAMGTESGVENSTNANLNKNRNHRTMPILKLDKLSQSTHWCKVGCAQEPVSFPGPQLHVMCSLGMRLKAHMVIMNWIRHSTKSHVMQSTHEAGKISISCHQSQDEESVKCIILLWNGTPWAGQLGKQDNLDIFQDILLSRTFCWIGRFAKQDTLLSRTHC